MRTFSLSLINILFAYFAVLAYRWWGWVGDFKVHCIASSEDVVTLKIGLAYRWWGVLTFIALRHEKMLLRLGSFSYTDGGVGDDVTVHCIASSGDVATLKMLLRSSCCYVQDVVRFKMLSGWRCCYFVDVVTFMLLLRSRCCYVEDVVTFKMLLRWRCCCVEDVVRLKMLLHSICCYVEDVVTLKMLLRWRCC